MIVKHLGDTDFNDIMDCFLKAFENYFVKMPTDYNFYKERWKAAKVRLDLSYGMFDDDQLVGFIINAIDYRNEEFVAFNTGTGVIPNYRGQKIVKSIYNKAFPQLKAHGITKCGLEVITENAIAIKSYERIGFKKCKLLVCVQGEINVNEFEDIVLREQPYSDIDWSKISNQDTYAWDFHHTVLEKGNYKYVQVYYLNQLESFFVIHNEHKHLAQFEVLNETPLVWDRMFSAIARYSKSIKINNIDAASKTKLDAVKRFGLVNTVNQFEMEMSLLD